ncbi:MAG: hypothetical protein ACLFVJ_11170 [Persicimonas sp.]
MSHLRILLGARLQALGNRASGHSPGWWAARVGAIVVVLGGLMGLGHAAAPGLLEPPNDVVTAMGIGDPGDESNGLPSGAAALEAAFWLAALASTVLNFRVMELLFRRRDIRSVESYPIRLYALYVDRLIASLGEALAATVLLAPFFVPLLWHGGGLAASTSIALIGLGLIASSAIGFAVQLAAGYTLAGGSPGDQDQKKHKSRDIYGGSGQIFLYSPGVALAVSVLVILLAKLALGEVLCAGETTRAFSVGLGILGASFAIAILTSYRYFVEAFPAMAARFREADFVGFEVSARHQTSEFERPKFGERLLPAGARAVFRAYALQFSRRYMLARWTYVLGWFAAGIAVFRLSEAALPIWLVATLPAIAAASLVNPWVRLSTPRIRPEYHNLLPLTPRADLSAAALFALRECLLVTVPYALLVLLAQGLRHQAWLDGALLAALAVGACVASNGAMTAAWRLWGRSRVVELFVPVVLAIGLVAVANLSLVALVVVEVVLVCGHFVGFAGGRERLSV